MNRYVLTLILLICMFAPIEYATAQSYQQQFIVELNRLMEQLLELQQFNTTAIPAHWNHSLTPSQYYTGPYEAIYLTDGTTVHPYGNTIYEAADIELWKLWRAVVGNATASRYFTEVRLYRDRDAKYDAFVERVDEDNWILGVNLAGIDLTNPVDRSTTIELFVHEYAHVLHYYYPEIATNFTEQFWSQYSKNGQNYVSEYAMLSAEEDFAESFMYFVLDLRPERGNTAREKIRFFSQYDEFEQIQRDILDSIR